MDYAGILTSTAQSLAPYVVDGLHNGSVLPARLMTKPVPWDQGQYYQQPIQVTEDNDNGGDFVGMPVFDVSASNNDKNLMWLAKGRRQSIVIPLAEIAHNKTRAGVISLVERKMDKTRNALKNQMGNVLFGLGMGDAIEGLDLMTDNSTQTSTYGLLSRSTYGSVINGQVNSVPTLSLTALGVQMDACTPANTDEGTTLNLTTKTVWGYVEQILDAKSRQMFQNIPVYVTQYTENGEAVPAAEKGAASGFTALFHRGVPMVKDEKTTSGSIYNLNEPMIDFVSLEFPEMDTVSLANQVTKGVYEAEPSPTSFQITKMLNPYNQLGKIGHMIAYGNLINRNPVRGGVMRNVAGI